MRPILMAIAATAALAALPAHAQQRDQVIDDVHRFALAEFDRIQPKSIAENRAYCGYIAMRENGTLMATPARPGNGLACDPGPAPKGLDVMATYRTQGGFSGKPRIEAPQGQGIAADLARGTDGYIATPGGRVWLHLTVENSVYQVCGRGCVKPDTKARRCAGFVPKIEYTRDDLQKLEKTPEPKC